MTTIETERLILRPPGLADFEDLAQVSANPEVMRYLGDGTPLSRFKSMAELRRGCRTMREGASLTGVRIGN